MIGVFDSGIGGITVLKELIRRFPHEDFIYLGDTARLPYGTKSAQTIRKYSEQTLQFLLQKNVRALVIACNSASSQMPEDNFHGVPLFNVITPGAKQALKISQTKRIGLLGTKATVNSGSYSKAVHELDPQAQVFSQACPLLVPLAEEAWIDDPITNLVVYRYVQCLLPHQIDTVILGCTHYPILRSAIQKAVGTNIQLVDSGNALADDMQEKLKFDAHQMSSRLDIFCTDLSDSFFSLTQKLLSEVIDNRELHFHLADL